MPLDAFLNGYQFNPEGFDFEKFKADLLKEYSDDISVRDTKITDTTNALSEAQAEVGKWKIRNFDLLQKIPADESKQGNASNPAGKEGSEETDPMDTLFGTEKV